MKKFIFYIIFFNSLLLVEINSSEINDSKLNYEQVINIGKMQSHNKKFTLYFKTRDKAVLAKGEEFNHIIDYPQDLYYLNNSSGKIYPLITYDWFPKKVKELGTNYELPIFPEDFAYYLLSDNQTLLMISGIKSIKSNYQFNIRSQKLDILSKNNNYKLRFIFSLLKKCGFSSLNATYECSFYKPLISENLIR